MKKLGQSFLSFNAVAAKITKTLLWLVLPDEICLVSSRHTAVILQDHIICVLVKELLLYDLSTELT